jgi:hypothetical protein
LSSGQPESKSIRDEEERTVSVTVYGTVVSIESTGPPAVDVPPEAPGTEVPPTEGASQLPAALALRAMRDDMPAYYRARVVAAAEPREGEEAPKLWVHVHILLDPPHVGELQVNAPESQVGGLLVVDGRARITVSSN